MWITSDEIDNGVWLSLVECPLWEREAAGSSPATPTDANLNQVGIVGASLLTAGGCRPTALLYINGRSALVQCATPVRLRETGLK